MKLLNAPVSITSVWLHQGQIKYRFLAKKGIVKKSDYYIITRFKINVILFKFKL